MLSLGLFVCLFAYLLKRLLWISDPDLNTDSDPGYSFFTFQNCNFLQDRAFFEIFGLFRSWVNFSIFHASGFESVSKIQDHFSSFKL